VIHISVLNIAFLESLCIFSHLQLIDYLLDIPSSIEGRLYSVRLILWSVILPEDNYRSGFLPSGRPLRPSFSVCGIPHQDIFDIPDYIALSGVPSGLCHNFSAGISHPGM